MKTIESLEHLEQKKRQAYEEYEKLCAKIERMKESNEEVEKKKMNEKYAGKYYRSTRNNGDIDIMYVKVFTSHDECICDQAIKSEYLDKFDIHFYKNDVFVFHPEYMKQITQTEYLDTLKELFTSAKELELYQYEL